MLPIEMWEGGGVNASFRVKSLLSSPSPSTASKKKSVTIHSGKGGLLSNSFRWKYSFSRGSNSWFSTHRLNCICSPGFMLVLFCRYWEYSEKDCTVLLLFLRFIWSQFCTVIKHANRSEFCLFSMQGSCLFYSVL
jgi:hypothetical protein